MIRARSITHVAPVFIAALALCAVVSCKRATEPTARTFATPDDAVRALIEAAKANSLQNVVALFGPEGQDLVDSSDAATGRRNREVFTVAVAERWQLQDQPDGRKVLVIGDESWPFPVPLVKDANGWRFDTAAGKEEIIARRIGRNELAVIQVCRAYVVAQRLYAERGHDGHPAGIYAARFQSDAGKQNGLYWPVERGVKRSPRGDLVAQAAEEGRPLGQAGEKPPFHGYYFKILTGQGSSAPGGAKDYVVNGLMSGGFALVAWPAQYDVTGVMTFVVNHDGVVHEKDLGPETAALIKAMTRYDPESSWAQVQ